MRVISLTDLFINLGHRNIKADLRIVARNWRSVMRQLKVANFPIQLKNLRVLCRPYCAQPVSDSCDNVSTKVVLPCPDYDQRMSMAIRRGNFGEDTHVRVPLCHLLQLPHQYLPGSGSRPRAYGRREACLIRETENHQSYDR